MLPVWGAYFSRGLFSDVKRGHKCYKEFVPIVITSHNCNFKGKDTKVIRPE